MSFSTLREIETCPLRWGLRRAAYDFSAARPGYPASVGLGSLTGQVVHTALEIILGTIALTSDVSPEDTVSKSQVVLSGEPNVGIVAVLRKLGGISAVLDRAAKRITNSWEVNPRVAPRAQEWSLQLQRQLSLCREQVQQLLGQIDTSNFFETISSSEFPHPDQKKHPGLIAEEDSRSGIATATPGYPLLAGVHSEVPLSSPTLDWFGKADLIRLDEDECSITDFKTGAPKEDHALQLRIYALLWDRDSRLNPRAIRATRLRIVYSSGSRSVDAPGTEGLNELEKELQMRSQSARIAVSTVPPEARPSRSGCQWCDVRHLCRTYWQTATWNDLHTPMASNSEQQVAADQPAATGSFNWADLELVVSARQGEWSWHAIVVAVGALSDGIDVGQSIVVRAIPGDRFFSKRMIPGRQVRVTAVQLLEASEESANRQVALLGRRSEAFLVPI